MKKYGKRLYFKTVQQGRHRSQPWIIQAVIMDKVLGQGTSMNEKLAKKTAARLALLQPVPAELDTPQHKAFRQQYGREHPQMDVGHLKEALLVDAFNDRWAPRRPDWLTDLRLSTLDEDRRGIDIVAYTSRGLIPVQVKSSGVEAQRHQKKSDTPVFVYTSYEMPFAAYEAFLHWLTAIYKRLPR